MLSPTKIKQEIFSSTDDSECEESGDEAEDEKKIELLEFERNLMLDTFSDDVLFILARGLALERLILHHLRLYSDQKLLVFVINTTQHDEAYFLSKLRNEKCPPKIITSDISVKERENMYMEGGIQFITSRILMVDLLQNRVPVKNVAGIVVHRAHQLLSSYQESFILRLYREKKADGFVKAFTDNPGVLNSIGVMQRLVNQLYIRRVRLLPRFDVDVKRILDLYSPTLIELYSDLPLPMRRIQSALVDIIRTCLKELKQSSSVEVTNEEEVSSPSAGLTATPLEIQLKAQQSTLSEKQQRLLSDLKQLRTLLFEAEELDPTVVFKHLAAIRIDKEQLSSNSGWLFTQTASKLFSQAESICKLKKDNDFTILEPPKWSALKNAMKEIREITKERRNKGLKVSPVLLIASSNEVCLLLRDLIKFGPNLLKWIKMREVMTQLSISSRKNEPEREPFWDPAQMVLFASNIEGEKRSDILMSMKSLQKEAAKQGKRRRKLVESEIKKKKIADGEGQTKLVQFGVVHYRKSKKEDDVVEETERSGETPAEVLNHEEVMLSDGQAADPLLLIFPQGERYNLLRQLENLQPSNVILYHSDLVTLRILETYKACNPENDLRIYVLMYGQSNEEERYLCSLRREQLAFEHLIREQGMLMIPREYETSREAPPTLKLTESTRASGGRVEEVEEETPRVIIDMREFNSELPTILYKRGTDLVPATLEVGDYILTPDTAVERKALDDLSQSLHSGRVFKQIDQMLRHYKNVMLLVEANTKDSYKKINGGPFQGELSRRCRETRYLFTVLIRSYPAMSVIWSVDPVNSAEIFEEFKLNEMNPDLEQAVAVKSDADSTVKNSSESTKENSQKEKLPVLRVNPVLQRQLCRLPGLALGDVTRMMKSNKATCLLDVINADLDVVAESLDNLVLATDLQRFFSTNLCVESLTK